MINQTSALAKSCWTVLFLGFAVLAFIPVLGIFIYAPLFFVAFVLSIVLLAKNNSKAGLPILLILIIVVPIFAFIRFAIMAA